MANKRQIVDLQDVYCLFIDKKQGFVGYNLMVIDQSACFTGKKH
jgi:hypothetical protein